MDADSLHKKGEEARESGDFLEALKCCEEAGVEYIKAANVVKGAETCASRALTYRHLADTTGKKDFLTLAKFAAKAGVRLIEDSGSDEGKTTPLYTLAKVYESLERFDKAAEFVKEAIDSASDAPKAQVAEMKTRLDALSYRNGETSALESFNADVEDLVSGGFDDEYVKHVWLSGAYMHMAEAM